MDKLGYNRCAKKCKEKFENIYKYHRRTKDGRSGRCNGKNYRFFEQLEAIDSFHSPAPHPSLEKVHNFVSDAAITSPTNVIHDAIPCSIHNPTSNSADNSTSSTSFSSRESEGGHKKKSKLTEFFGRLMKEVIDKQQLLQTNFIEMLEKLENDRAAREEAWKMQELARIQRERELLAQERSIAAAKDAAVLTFLKTFSERSGPVQFPENPIFGEGAMNQQEKSNGVSAVDINFDKQELSSRRKFMQTSSSRWPRDEVEALINLRSNLELEYQENAPKGPLWEEISAAMKKLGYDRNAKRCKEKWENINKYFKRVKESNKKRSEDSKTCPYFQQLDALYNMKAKKVDSSVNSGYGLRPEELLIHMMGGQEEQQRPESVSEDDDSENVEQNREGNNDSTNANVNGDDFQTVADNPPMENMGELTK